MLILQDVIKSLSYELFHKHEHPTDQQLKKLLKGKLVNDKYCIDHLNKLQGKSISFDQLWDDKLHSVVSNIQ